VTIKHEGVSAHRLKPEAGNPREVVFAEKWGQENAENRSFHPALWMLVCTRSTQRNGSFMPGLGGVEEFCELTQRDATVAATVIQWLGSNVGWSFLNECVERCGYKIVADSKGGGK
jgi:hypothetical protein